ncbi:hypothetical protein KCV07_g236, partial [Aureobasidium melanogenum]
MRSKILLYKLLKSFIGKHSLAAGDINQATSDLTAFHQLLLRLLNVECPTDLDEVQIFVAKCVDEGRFPRRNVAIEHDRPVEELPHSVCIVRCRGIVALICLEGFRDPGNASPSHFIQFVLLTAFESDLCSSHEGRCSIGALVRGIVKCRTNRICEIHQCLRTIQVYFEEMKSVLRNAIFGYNDFAIGFLFAIRTSVEHCLTLISIQRRRLYPGVFGDITMSPLRTETVSVCARRLARCAWTWGARFRRTASGCERSRHFEEKSKIGEDTIPDFEQMCKG